METLAKLEQTLQDRRTADAADSYVASLYARGLNKILEKVGEEATETIIAAKDAARLQGGDEATAARRALVAETADLWFHSLVMLVQLDLSVADVLAELERRMGVSGHAEKAQRNS